MIKTTAQRIPPLEPPYREELSRTISRLMPQSMEPIRIFRTLAHNHSILDKMIRGLGTYLLNFGTVDPLEREIVIARATARCDAEYEWGVHIDFFGRRLGLTEEQIASTVHGAPSDACWSERQTLLLRLVDELHETVTVSDELWDSLDAGWTSAQIIELIVIAGQYHAISFLVNALRIQLEDGAARFPAFPG
ncbi:MAG TPA: carboxymuconolactone decarboxylase family protein [Dehalococcoidia bacterium]|nr:carboxymuconolactone decarboxylase family protein [Dehalococcoidia bacterium]